ncbi:MAG TPA: hypothetical protein VHU62_01455, partial [Mycobacterium sp.]|nr:hypothetical protein [Mycobacterium sp.]
LTVVCAGCAGSSTAPQAGSSSSSAPASPGSMTITEHYAPTIEPSGFSTTITNPYFPLTPGTRMIYEADTSDGLQRTTTEVTHDIKNVMGVDTVVVHDTVSLDNKPIEDTVDWYAQDRDGNVWYFGEATKAFKDGAIETAGSFEGGVNGALPGIIMPGHPQIGDQYREEYARGVAEDAAEVVSLTGSENTPLTGSAKHLLVIKDTNLLDPTGPAENKYYASGVGRILTVPVSGSPERDQAAKLEKF